MSMDDRPPVTLPQARARLLDAETAVAALRARLAVAEAAEREVAEALAALYRKAVDVAVDEANTARDQVTAFERLVSARRALLADLEVAMDQAERFGRPDRARHLTTLRERVALDLSQLEAAD